MGKSSIQNQKRFIVKLKTADLFRFPVWWLSVHAYFENTVNVAVAGLVMAAIVGFAAFILLRFLQKFGRRILNIIRQQQSFT
jgi:ABC-type Fe3+ transport system permease subunit